MWSESVEKIRSTIVQISFLASGLSRETYEKVSTPFTNRVLGTGFFVNSDGYVITAKHVIDLGRELVNRIDACNKQILIGLAFPNTENFRGNFSLVDFDVIGEDARHDLILLKLRKNPFKREVRSGFVVNGKELPLLYGTPTFNLNRPREGAAIGISGYPLNEMVLVTNFGWIASSWETDIQEVSLPGAPPWFRVPDIADLYLGDVEVNPGNSGAPTYLIKNSTIIGMCVGSKIAPVRDQYGNQVSMDGKRLFYSSGLTLIVPTRYIIELLEKQNVKCNVLN